MWKQQCSDLNIKDVLENVQMYQFLLCCVFKQEKFLFLSFHLSSGTPKSASVDHLWGRELHVEVTPSRVALAICHLSSRLPAACKDVQVSVLASHCPQQCQQCSTDK